MGLRKRIRDIRLRRWVDHTRDLRNADHYELEHRTGIVGGKHLFFKSPLREIDELFRESGKFSMKDFISKKLKRRKAFIGGRVKIPVRVLDLGCGDGTALKGIREKFPEAAEAGGLELHGILAESRIPGSGLEGIEIKRALFRDTAELFPAKHFDLVYSHYGLLHEPQNIVQNIQGIKQVLKKDGILVFNCDGKREIPKKAFEGFEVMNSGQVYVLRKK